MDESDTNEAIDLLGRVLAAIEAGELEASPAQVGALVGARESLKAIR